MPPERLQRALARAGFGSRRACEELIARGRVEVDGRVATLGDRVDPASQRVRVDGVEVNLDPRVRYYALHKPRGVVTTMRDPQGRPDINAFLPEDAVGVVPVGRLDRDSEGLLLLMNDGELANRLTHPSFGVEKEYLAEVAASPRPAQLARLREGVVLDDGRARAVAASLVGRHAGRSAIRVVMTEGRKREVRRMLQAAGLPVTRLVRVRIGPVRLGNLEPGRVRPLSTAEVRALARAAGR
jgi:23S rRNA pseudouridine2605 synthase